MGATRNQAVLGLVIGAFGGALFALADPRRRIAVRALPIRASGAADEPWWRAALRGTYPSTLGLAVLGGISLAFSPALAAVLAGIAGGLGIAGLVLGLAAAGND